MESAKDLMSTKLITISVTDTLANAAKLLLKEKIFSIPVLDSHEAVVGLLTEQSLLRCYVLLKGQKKTNETLEKLIQYFEVPVLCSKQTEFFEVLTLMIRSQSSRILVKDEKGKLAGIISPRDLIHSFVMMEF
ncbi:MAG: HPP family protein [Bdellovibrionales bacterium]